MNVFTFIVFKSPHSDKNRRLINAETFYHNVNVENPYEALRQPHNDGRK